MATLAQQQIAALNGLIAAIAPTNAFYRPRLAAADGLAGFESLARYCERMPFTTKEELVADQLAHPWYGTALTYPRERYTRFHQTSGTSGRPLVWLDDPESWQWVLDNWKVVWERAGARRGDAAFFPFSFGPFLGFWAAFDSAVQLGIRAIPAGGLGSLERLRFLLRHQPRLLCCTPTYALRLAEVAREESIDLAACGVERLLVAGEPGGSIREIRGRIEAAWRGARVVDHHGMTEVGPVSYGEIDRPTTLRLIHHSYLCEVIRPGTNEPVAPGDCGELVLTTLGRAACPLFRYRTGDLVRPVPVAGDDPAAFALEGGVLGRVDDMVIVRGVNLYPAAVDAVVRSIEGIGEYQVQIDQRVTLPEITVHFDASADTGDPTADLTKQLREAFQMRINVKKVPKGTLPVFEMKARRWQVLR